MKVLSSLLIFAASIPVTAAIVTPGPGTGTYGFAQANGNTIFGNDPLGTCATASINGTGLSSACSIAIPSIDLPDTVGGHASFGFQVITSAVGRADGAQGTVAGRAWAIGTTGDMEKSEATARIVDTIVFNSPTAEFRPSVTASFSVGGPDHMATYLQTNLVYFFAIEPFSLDYYFANGYTLNQIATGVNVLNSWRVSAGRYRDQGVNEEFFYYGPDNAGYGASDDLPGTDNPRTWSTSILMTNLPVGLPMKITSELELGARCAPPTANSECTAMMESMGSAKLGIVGDYTSVSGFSYPGASDTSAVPEPASGVLMVAGLAALWVCRRA